MHKLMLVEDDTTIRSGIVALLEKWGYQVIAIEKFDEVLTTYIAEKPHLVILDITLPFYNGYYWCQEIRKLDKVPILFLSSHNEPMDIVMSINMGADDYITKPFDPSILVAKIQSLLRRSYEFATEQTWIEHNGLVLDLKSTIATYHGTSIDLTKNEYQILRVLMENHDGFVSRERLMQELWNSDLFIDDNTLTVNVARLRKKMEEVGIKELIRTKKGIGYGLVSG